MSAHAYEPLRAVPTPPSDRDRFAHEIVRRRRLKRAWDALRSAPAKAAGYAARLADALRVTRPAGWVRHQGVRLWRPLATLPARLGRSGLAAAAVVVVTSPAGQAVIRMVASLLSRAARWVGRSVHRMVGVGLRLLGAPGQQAANTLDRWVGRLVRRGGALLGAAASQLRRWTDPASPLIRAVAGISRGFLLHRVLRLVVANSYARLLVEGLVGLVTVDSRPLVWLRRELTALRLRLGRRPAVTPEPRAGRPTPKRPTRRQRLSPRDEQAIEDEQLTMPDWEPAEGTEIDEEEQEQPLLPEAINRAERRQRDRQARRRPRPPHQQ